ncbi:hypothetical protein HUU39_27420, partial [candidate division KSB1 bacterium]|nr:hypothetical protein [candidate division KSB1 bacterium]
MATYLQALQLRWQSWLRAEPETREEWKKFVWLLTAFLAFYLLPLTSADATRALAGGLALLQEYAR